MPAQRGVRRRRPNFFKGGKSVARNSLIQGNSTANAANYKTVSITPGANRLVLAFVMNVRGTAAQPAVAPTASGNNLTWVQVATVQIVGAPNRRLTCFRATGPAPAAGELTFDFGAEQQADCAWSVFEYAGVDTSGVVQTKTLSGGAILSITLDPLADPATSVVVGGLIAAPLFGFPAPIQPGAGMTQIHEQNVAEPGTGGSLQTEDRIGGTTAVTWTSVGGLGVAAIALELKAGVSIAEALELSKRFEPILFFHPEEKFSARQRQALHREMRAMESRGALRREGLLRRQGRAIPALAAHRQGEHSGDQDRARHVLGRQPR
jgi:hypothetical protein